MSEILSSQVWQFWGFIVGVIAIIVAILTAVWSRTRKRLNYEFLFATSVVSVNPKVQKKIKIEYDREPVTNLHVLLLALRNIGNKAISTEDFRYPVTFVFERDVKLIEPVVEKTNVLPKPEFSEKQLDEDGHWRVSLKPLLMNQNDFLSIRFLVDGPPKPPAVVGKICDGEIKEVATQRSLRRWAKAFNISLVGFGFVIVAFAVARGRDADFPFMPSTELLVIGNAVWVFGILALVSSAMLNRIQAKLIKENPFLASSEDPKPTS